MYNPPRVQGVSRIREAPVLVTGATGYVGGRLVPQLLQSGYRARVVGRSPSKLRSRSWGMHPKLAVAETDALDRVLDLREGRFLQLLAEMRFPGEATLEFKLSALPGGRTALVQHSRYLPRGLAGLLYWYALLPFHVMIFKGMLKGIAGVTGKPILEGLRRAT